jgi:DNA-binding NarL/FixJ family response regulator
MRWRCRTPVTFLDCESQDIAQSETHQILAMRPDARIVFVTVQDSRAIIRKALDCGARGYVLKCDAGNELVAAVRTVLEGGYYLSLNARCALGKGAPAGSHG